MLNRFHCRLARVGSSEENDDYNIEDIAFSFSEFFTSQYFLSPNRGVLIGTGGDAYIDALYPSFAFQSPAGFVRAGTLSGQHPYADGFVLGGVRIKVVDLAGPASVDVLSGDSVLASLTVAPDENGAGSAVKFFSDARFQNLCVSVWRPMPNSNGQQVQSTARRPSNGVQTGNP